MIAVPLPDNHRWVTKWMLSCPALGLTSQTLSHLFCCLNSVAVSHLSPSVELPVWWLPRMSLLFVVLCCSLPGGGPPSPLDGPLWRLGLGCYWSLPLGICCLWRRPGCLASVRGVSWRIVSSLHCVSWQQRSLALCGNSSLYLMLYVLLGCCVFPH